MKKIILMLIYSLVSSAAMAQVFYNVTNLPGTSATVACTNVNVVGTGRIMYAPITCGAGPYSIGLDPAAIPGLGSITWNFTPGATQVQFDMDALEAGDNNRIFINGIQYTGPVGPYPSPCIYSWPVAPPFYGAGGILTTTAGHDAPLHMLITLASAGVASINSIRIESLGGSNGTSNNLSFVPLNPPPTAYPILGGGASCLPAGVNVSLSDSDPGIQYQLHLGGAPLTAPGDIIIGTGALLNFGFRTISGNYTVVATDLTTGCQITMPGTAVVTTTAPATANAGLPQSVCAGGTISLAGTIGGSATSSIWSAPSGTFSAPGSLTSTYTPSITSGTVVLTLTTNDPDGAGPCTAATSTVVITVDPAPAALIPTGAGSFCASSTIISAGPAVSGVTIYFQGTTPGGTSTATPSSSEVVTASGTYFFRPRTSAGCWGPQCAINVNLSSAATAIAGLPQSICAGGTVTLAGTIGGSATTSMWSAPSGTFSAPGSLTSTYTPSITSGTVILTLTTNDPDGAGPCAAAISTVVITVDPAPAALVPAGGGTYCVGSATISAGPTVSGVTIYFQGTTSGGTSTATPSSSEVVTASGTYYFRPQSSAGCWGPQCSITVFLTPGFTANAGLPQSVCAGGTITLSGSIGGGASSSIWTAPSGTFSSPSSLTSTYTPSITGGTVTLTLTTNDPDGAGPCTAATSTVVITVDPAPAALTPTGAGSFCATSTTISAGPAVSGVTIYFQGTTSGGTSTATPSSSEVITSSGTYYFRPQSSAGCWGPQCAINVILSSGATANAGLPQSVCAGGTITLAGSIGGGASSSIWTAPSGTFSAPGSLTSTYTPGITTGTVILTLTTNDPDGTGPCTAAVSTVTITVDPLPAPIIPSGAGTYCGSTSISASPAVPGVTIYFQGTTSGGTSTSLGGSPQTVTSSGTYYFRPQSSAGCWGPQCSIVVVITPGATVSAGIPISMCVGGTVTLAGSIGGGATSSTWTAPSGTFSDPTSLTSTYTPSITSGTVILTLTTDDPPGPCPPATSTVVITVNPLPPISVVVGGGSYCTGGTGVFVGLSGSVTGVSYQLYLSGSPIGSPLAGTGGALSFGLQTAAGVYTVVATNTTTLCSRNMAGSATVAINPFPGTIVGPTSICLNSTFTYTNTVPGGTWSSSITGVATIHSVSGALSPHAAGTTTITYTNSCGSVSFLLTILAAPLPISFAPTHVCEALTATLTDATPGGNWISVNPAIATVDFWTGVVTGVSAGVATIDYILPNGCFVSRTITVDHIEPITGVPDHPCAWGSTFLVNDATLGGAYSSTLVTVLNLGAGDGLVTTFAPGPATITYTAGVCSTTVHFIVDPLPLGFTFIGAGTGCYGTAYPAKLASSQVGASYQLFRSGTPVGAPLLGTGGLLDFGPQTAVGVYTIVSTIIATGCSVPMYGTLTINPLPEPITGYTTPICPSATVLLSTTSTGGSWSSSNTSIATVGVSGLVTGVSGGLATISYTLPTGCYVTQLVNILPPGTLSGPSTVCTGATITLSDAFTGGTWSSSTSDATVTAGTAPGDGDVTGVSAGSTVITYTIGGCYVTKAISVLPSPTPIMGAPVSICVGDIVTIYDLTWSGTWSSSNTAVLDILSTYTGSAEYCKIKGISAGTATITYMSGGCITTVNIIVHPLPGPFPPVSVYPGCTVSVPDPGTGTWSSFDPTVATATGMTGHCVIYGATLAGGTTTVTYTSSITGCSNSFVVTVIYSGGFYACKPGRTDDPTGITAPSELSTEVSVYPNPTRDNVTITYPCKTAGQLVIGIKDISGRMRHTESVICDRGNDVQHVVDMSTFAPGMYFIEITLNDQRVIKKVVKQ